MEGLTENPKLPHQSEGYYNYLSRSISEIQIKEIRLLSSRVGALIFIVDMSGLRLPLERLVTQDES